MLVGMLVSTQSAGESLATEPQEKVNLCYYHHLSTNPHTLLTLPALEDGNAVSLALTHLASEAQVVVPHWQQPAPDVRGLLKEHRLVRP